MIKAYMCKLHLDEEWCLLVFATTRGKAKSFMMNEFGDTFCEYTDIIAWRRPDYDQFAPENEKAIWDNEGLPDGIEFYVDIY